MKNYYSFDKSLNLKLGNLKDNKTNKTKAKNDISKNILLAKYSNIGYYLMTPILIGVFLGLYLDGRLGTNYLVVIGIIIGSISTIYNLFRLLKQ